MAMNEIHNRRDERLEERKKLWDEIISKRHREWGIECKMFDIDHFSCSNPYPYTKGMLCMEGYWGKTCMLTEYKHEYVLKDDDAWGSGFKWQMQCYRDLANPGGKPVFCCVYHEANFAMVVLPANMYAREWVPGPTWMTEREWVRLMHKVRGITASERTLRKLHDTYPGEEEQYRLVV